MKWLTATTLAVSLAACGGKEGGPDHGGVSLAAAPQEIARAVCPKAHVCCTPMQLMGNDLAGKDERDCEAKTAEGFRKNLMGLEGSIKNGRAAFRGDKLEACLAYIRASSCEQLNRTNRFSGLDCEPYVQPLVASGGVCGADHECIEGACKKAPMAWEGTCQPLPRDGQPCDDNRCAPGQLCQPDKTCAAALTDGTSCTANTQCRSGNCSDPFGSGAKSCAPPTAADRCFYASACSYGRAPLTAGIFLSASALLMLFVALRVRASAPDPVAE